MRNTCKYTIGKYHHGISSNDILIAHKYRTRYATSCDFKQVLVFIRTRPRRSRYLTIHAVQKDANGEWQAASFRVTRRMCSLFIGFPQIDGHYDSRFNVIQIKI